MELEEKDRDNLDNDSDLQNQGFSEQQPLSDDKIKNVLAVIAKIGKDENFKKAELIDRSKAVKDLLKKFDKNKATPQEVTKLRRIYYDNYDQEREDFLYEAELKRIREENRIKSLKRKQGDMIKEARLNATLEVLNSCRNDVIKVLKDAKCKEAVSKVKSTIKINLVNTNKNKDNQPLNQILEPQIDLDAVKEVEDAAMKVEWGNDLEGDNYLKEHESEYAERRAKIISEIKKKKQDKFLKALSVYEKVSNSQRAMIDSLAKMNKKTTDHGFGKANDYCVNDWKVVGEKYLQDVEFALKQYIAACAANANEKDKTCNNMGAFVQLGAVGVAMFNRIKNLEETVNNLVNTINALVEQMATFGKLSQDDVLKVNKKAAQKNSSAKDYIDNEKWYQMSNFEKFKAKFNFRDFVQNPPKAWWKTFTEKEKIEVLKRKVEWQKKRLVELSELYSSKGEDVAARFIDSFFYYENKDKFGFTLDYADIKDIPKLDEESKLIYEDLKERLETLDEKKLVFNKVFYNNTIIRTKGLSSQKKIEEMIKAKSEKKFNRNNKYPNPQSQFYYNDYFYYDSQYNQDNPQSGPGYRPPYKRQFRPKVNKNNGLLHNKRNPTRGNDSLNFNDSRYKSKQNPLNSSSSNSSNNNSPFKNNSNSNFQN